MDTQDAAQAPPAEPSIDALIRQYVLVRDKKAQVKKRHREELAVFDRALALFEAKFLQFLQTNGGDSFKAETGTIYRSTQTSATVADWEAFFDFVHSQEAWHFLEHRCSKEAVQAFVASKGEPPPGVNLSSFTTVGVRRGNVTSNDESEQ